MTNIERYSSSAFKHLHGEAYFTAILQEASVHGHLNDFMLEKIQGQCLMLLAKKSQQYNGGDSSSLKVEVAENIMRSLLYTLGIYLKALPSPEDAIDELKTAEISALYQKGKVLIKEKFAVAQNNYQKIQAGKLKTVNYTYNATVTQNGLGSFFALYDPEYAAHETPGSIDYQLSQPVIGLGGVEYIAKYLENLLLENEFCRYFDEERIHYLLCGYDEGYQDLLLNLFEQVFIGALGCMLARRSLLKLTISAEDLVNLQNELRKDEARVIAQKLCQATRKIGQELHITNNSLQRYLARSLRKITAQIVLAKGTNTLAQTFVVPFNPDLKPKIHFSTGTKMEDEDYRQLFEELRGCRYLSDKLSLIKEKVQSFGDLEDILFDAQLEEEEIMVILGTLAEGEIAALIKRHLLTKGMDSADLSESERTLSLALNRYLTQLAGEQKNQLLQAAQQLVLDY